MHPPDPQLPALALWSDDPAAVDLLSFDAVASTVADALLDEALDPVALGVSGAWGSGKTTVLGLLEHELGARDLNDKKVLIIKTEPWRYDPSTGAKESLIGEVLTGLAAEITDGEPEAKQLVVRLAKRIDWAKAVKVAAKTSIALQLPSIDDLTSLVKPAEDGDDGSVRGLDEFRSEFEDLMSSNGLQHLAAVVVLVDDLDRCLPETVIETLEAIRLFLAVPKMSFVIAADEERVADAIRRRFVSTETDTSATEEGEEPAKLYLHKIVQTTIPLPALSRFDTQAFLLLLLAQESADESQLGTLIGQCAEIRRSGGSMDDLEEIDGLDLSDALAFASRLTPLLYEKLRGNPRRLKRFLNDLRVRQSIAARRGIDLDAAIIAKLMVLEVLLPEDFGKVLDWLAQGSLRDQLAQLETAAGRPQEPQEGNGEDQSEQPEDGQSGDAGGAQDGAFSEGLLRWAKLPPPLQGIDLSPYLYLAASFSGVSLLDKSLPERLRDIAANLLSSSQADRSAVTSDDIAALSDSEAAALLTHFGRTIRDQPTRQKMGVTAILRIAKQRPALAESAQAALLMLPPAEVSAATPLLFKEDDPKDLLAVLERWRTQAKDDRVVKAIRSVMPEGGSNS